MRTWLSILILVVLFLSTVSPVGAMDYTNQMYVKISLVENGVIHEWEYENPNKYEYEIGEKVIKGEEAKNAFTKIFDIIKLHEEENVEKMVQLLIENGHSNLERLDIRMMNMNGKLYTWVWDK